jgi:hypothetical protein
MKVDEGWRSRYWPRNCRAAMMRRQLFETAAARTSGAGVGRWSMMSLSACSGRESMVVSSSVGIDAGEALP